MSSTRRNWYDHRYHLRQRMRQDHASGHDPGHGRAGFGLRCHYHELLQTDRAMLDAIEARFPGTVDQGILQRKKLGAIVFAEPAALQDLNRITHAAVKQEVLRRLAAEPALAAIDAIGLFEGDLAELCHITVAVTAPTELRIQRLTARDGISEEYARSRIAAQHDAAWFAERCSYVLENNGTIDAFATKCLAFFRQIGIIET